jgi:hypothetical protein
MQGNSRSTFLQLLLLHVAGLTILGISFLSETAHAIGAPPPCPLKVYVLDAATSRPVVGARLYYDGTRPEPFSARQWVREVWWKLNHPGTKMEKWKAWRETSDTLRTGADGAITYDNIGRIWLGFEAPGYIRRRIRVPEDLIRNVCCSCETETLWVNPITDNDRYDGGR